MMKAAQPAAVGRRERRQQETRERLFQSAMRLLSERDFSEVTIEMITEAADVGKGTFFNYFPNKEAIVSYRFEQQFQVLSELLGQGGRQGDRETKEQGEADAAARNTNHELRATSHEPRATNHEPSVWQRIRRTMHHVGDSDAHSKRLARNLLALGLVNDAVRAANLNVHQRVHEIAEGMIRDGQASGEIRSDLPARDLGDYLRTCYLSALYQWAETDDDEDFHAALDRSLGFAWRSIRNEPAK